MIDLNSINVEGVKIFNNGIAGKTKNVSVSVVAKDITEPDNYPDYKILLTDVNGYVLNEGFYINVVGKTEEDTKNKENTTLSRVAHIARALLPKDYEFPQMGTTTKEVLVNLFKLIKVNENNNKVNVFTSFGTKTKPNNYLKLRYFGAFMENTETPDTESLLFAKPNDLLNKIVETNVNKETNEALDFFKV